MIQPDNATPVENQSSTKGYLRGILKHLLRKNIELSRGVRARQNPGSRSSNITTLSVLSALFFLSLSQFTYADWQSSLTTLEINQVTTLVQKQHPVLQSRSLIAAATETSESLGIRLANQQVLLIELQTAKKRKKNDRRVAEVFTYDYSRAQTERRLVDVSTQTILEVKPIESVHLPLNTNEIEFVRQHLQASQQLQTSVQTEYEKQFGKSAPVLSELDSKISIWQPEQNRSPVSTTCVSQRCALVSIFTENNYNFSVEPVVNLHTGAIVLDAIQ